MLNRIGVAAALFATAIALSGCVVEATPVVGPGYGRVWVPAHCGYYGRCYPGHWA